MTPSEDPTTSDVVETLIFQTLERMEEEGPNAIESVASDHPELEKELRERWTALQAMGLVGVAEDAPMDLPENLGHYEVGARLGEGGMGLVFEGRDTTLGRTVALKLIRPELLSSKSLRERFARECQAVGRLQDPGIARVFGTGETDGLPFMAMERIHGGTLAQVLDVFSGRSPVGLSGADLHQAVCSLAGSDPVEFEDVALFNGSWYEACTRIARAVAEGLAHAHAAGVLHRDVKASNVMVTPHGRVVLIDFGLAQLDDAQGLTATGGRIGSLPYTAPERITVGAAPTASCDVYGVGVLLYELLALRLPFRASSEVALVRVIADAKPEPIGSIATDLAAPIAEACARAMRVDPARRTPSADALATDLSRALAGRPPIPYGDSAFAVLRSKWRAHPVAWTAIAASAALLLALPTVLLAVQVSAAERTARSDAASLSRLQLAVDAATELQEALPVTDAISGSELAALRTKVLEELVLIRAFMLRDGRLGAGAEALRARITLDHTEALRRLGRADEAPANAALASIPGSADQDADRDAVRAARLALASKGHGPFTATDLEGHIATLRELRPTTSDLLDATITLIDLLQHAAIEAQEAGAVDDARRWAQEAKGLIGPLVVALPGAAHIKEQHAQLVRLLHSLDASGEPR